jgi:tripartite ATP-independent transporter DctM subunit
VIEWALPLSMFLTLAVLLFSGFPVAFVLGGVGLGFGFIGMAFGMFSFPEFTSITLRIWGGIAENILLVAVPMFVFMGITLERSGVAEDLLDTMTLLLHRIRGGLAMSVTLMGTMLAASTGIIGASVVMMGVLALPAMLKRRYQPELAVGTICASGTLGILIPPSIMLVLMGDLLQIPVGDLFMGAVFPGLLLSALYLGYIGTVCLVRPDLAPPMAATERAAVGAGELAWKVLWSLLPPAFMVFAVLGSIFFGLATPTEASGVGAFGALSLAAIKGRLTIPMLREVLTRSAATVAMIFVIFIGATAFSYVFRSLGGEDVIDAALLSLPFGPWGILFVLMGAIFVLGFFFDWIEITLIILPVFGPIVSRLDFGAHLPVGDVTLWFAVLVAVNLQTSFLTPPFGFALFYLKGVAPPEITVAHLYRGIIPFVLVQLVGLGLMLAFPAIITWLPTMIFN